MTPIYLRITADLRTWTVLIDPDLGTCELWCESVHIGATKYHSVLGFSSLPREALSLMPTLTQELTAYKPLFAHQERMRSSDGAQAPSALGPSSASIP